MRALVARIGKAHGLRGEVTVQLHTDRPRERLAPGAVLLRGGETGPGVGSLTVRSARQHNGIWLVAFEEADDRTTAELLRDVRLFVDAAENAKDGASVNAAGDAGDDDAYDEDQLVGLTVHDPSGARLGEVTSLEIRTAQDLLGVRLDDGRTGLVPFVRALVPVVDLAGGRIVLDAPDGLFDLDDRA